jgi:hypothetical protein
MASDNNINMTSNGNTAPAQGPNHRIRHICEHCLDAVEYLYEVIPRTLVSKKKVRTAKDLPRRVTLSSL